MTPDEERTVRQALTAFAIAVIPRAEAAYTAAIARRVTGVAGGANVTIHAAHEAANAATGVADAVLAAAHAARGAASAAYGAADVALRAGDGGNAMVAVDAADAVVAVAVAAAEVVADVEMGGVTYKAVPVSYEVHRVAGAAELEKALDELQRATVGALTCCQRVFARLPPVPDGADKREGGELRRLGRVPRRLVAVAVAVLPAGDRVRFGEEWAGLLTELPTRRARARQLCSLLKGTPRQSWVLRRPEPGRRRV
jgi:hypothetical protein